MTVVYSCQDMEYVTRSLPGHRKGVTKSSDEEISSTEHLPCSHECIICCAHLNILPIAISLPVSTSDADTLLMSAVRVNGQML